MIQLGTNLRILIVGLNYAPELTGVGKYTGEMASRLAAEGHTVRVITVPPYYPEWRVADRYRAFVYKTENLSGVTVFRCPIWVPRRPTGLKRIIHLLSFAISSLPIMIRCAFWRPGFVWTVEPTLFTVPSTLLLARLTGAVSWLHIQDFEVDASADLNVVARSRAIAWALKIESWLMRKFDRVSTISDRMAEKALSKNVETQKLKKFPNWVDTDQIYPLGGATRFRSELTIPEDGIVALYSGNMGRKQGLEILVDVAQSLKADSRIYFVFCGGGPGLETLLSGCAGLDNVRFIPLQPIELLNELLNTADIHLLPQRAAAADLVMPSKLTGMLASGKAIIATAEKGTELAKLVSACGVVVEPENPELLRAAITRLADDTSLRQTMGQAGREYAENALSAKAVLGRFHDDIVDCVRQRTAQTDQATKH